MSDVAAAIAYLRSPLAIRARCEAIFEAGLAGSLSHFAVDLDALPAVAERVAAVTRAAYPDLRIPVASIASRRSTPGSRRCRPTTARGPGSTSS